tara:strand:- start:485 stop:1123 length:639 start_codon:yes stop_codon:yes gene_type:complete
MPVESVFATPIYADMVDNLEKIQDEIGSAVEQINFDYREEWGTTHYLSDPTFKGNVIEEYKMDTFAAEIKKHVRKYIAQTFGPDGEDKVPKSADLVGYTLLHSWIALFKKGNYGHIHSHGEADIAGVYYHKKSDDASGLFFNTPVTGLENSIIFQHWANRCDSSAPEGSITLFPGFLKHGIQTHQGTTDRISLSFNIYFDKAELFKYGEIFA